MKDFNENMYLFSARPDFELSFDNNMPWFDHYKVKLNNEIVENKNQKYFIKLNDGINVIEVVAVNENGIEGIPTIMKIRYE